MSVRREGVLAEIARRVDLVELVGEHVRLKRVGRSWQGLCPFHQEKTPSFTVDPERGLFYCFGCQTGGDLFTFVMKLWNVDFREAAHRLAARAGIDPDRLAPTPEAARRERERQALLQLHQWAAGLFQHWLEGGAGRAAREYLASRGIAAETARRFRLGYALPDWQALLAEARAAGFQPELLLRAGLLARSEGGRLYSRFRDRLMFPITDPSGQVIAFGGRLLGTGGEAAKGAGPKYLNSPETPLFRKGEGLYGLHLAREALRRLGEAVLVEGYVDVVSLHQHDFPQAVASLGTSLTEAQARLLAGRVARVVIAYDADSAGRRATLRGLELLARAELEVRVARLPAGEDPDSLVRRDPGGMARVLAEAVPLVEYRIEQALEGLDLGQAGQRLLGVRRVVRFLRSLPGPAEREIALEAAAHRLGLTPEVLRQELLPPAARVPAGRLRQARYTPAGPGYTRARALPAGERALVGQRTVLERTLVARLLADPAAAQRVAAWIRPQEIQDPEARQAFTALLEGRGVACAEPLRGGSVFLIEGPSTEELVAALRRLQVVAGLRRLVEDAGRAAREGKLAPLLEMVVRLRDLMEAAGKEIVFR